MLSKSQARMFFLTGTLLFSGVFLFLTIDSMASIPAQTKSQNISDEVKRGKHLFDRNNCMGCHTILGEGAYYAPELTKVYERRCPVWMKQFLKDPEAMYPGKRRMVNYHFSDAEIADLTAFFKWIGEMDLNGFPAKPDLKQAEPVKMASNGPAAPAMFSQICASCHSLGGAGGSVGPALDGVGTRRDAAWLSRWLADPPAVKPGTAMPKLPMSDAERAELVSFLSAQK
ncbi:MAG: c-type cytochrome [Candidatus Sericytochromatia bacterium]